MIELNKIYNEDCLVGMQRIPDKSIDCIICDLPYGLTACKWDVIIPFDKLWEQYNRIIKDDGAIVLFGNQPFTSLMVCSNLSMFREELIWEKNNSPSGFGKNQRHLKRHENICIFSKNSKYKYNPQKWYVPDDKIVHRKTLTFTEKNNIIDREGIVRTKNIDDGSRNPISILTYKVPYTPKKDSKTRNGDYRVHPTQKPLALIEYLVKTYSNENDTVLDNCIGSGTTALACINTNRNFVGFELEQKYYDIANERIAKALWQKTH